MNLIDSRLWLRLWAQECIIGLYFRITRGYSFLKLYEVGIYLIQKSNVIIASI